jgi:hypothetical protein
VVPDSPSPAITSKLASRKMHIWGAATSVGGGPRILSSYPHACQKRGVVSASLACCFPRASGRKLRGLTRQSICLLLPSFLRCSQSRNNAPSSVDDRTFTRVPPPDLLNPADSLAFTTTTKLLTASGELPLSRLPTLLHLFHLVSGRVEHWGLPMHCGLR